MYGFDSYDRWKTGYFGEDDGPECVETCQACNGDIYEGDICFEVGRYRIVICKECMDDVREIQT